MFTQPKRSGEPTPQPQGLDDEVFTVRLQLDLAEISVARLAR
jgi:hypothetical protein